MSTKKKSTKTPVKKAPVKAVATKAVKPEVKAAVPVVVSDPNGKPKKEKLDELLTLRIKKENLDFLSRYARTEEYRQKTGKKNAGAATVARELVEDWISKHKATV